MMFGEGVYINVDNFTLLSKS